MRKDLDYDSGDKLFNLTIRAEVRKIINIVQFGGQFGTIWDTLGQFGTLWGNMGQSRILWDSLGQFLTKKGQSGTMLFGTN